jgi:purine-binding chemotaxis protein CheW
MVTAVYNVLEIPDDQIEPAPEFGARIRAEFIRGMGKVDGNFVMILDVNQVLSLDEISTLATLGKEQANATGEIPRPERPLTRLC